MLTAADHSDADATQGAQMPCHCRISHNGLQSGRWLAMVVAQVFFWLCISRPVSIAVGMHASKKAKAWFHKNKQNLTRTMTRMRLKSMASAAGKAPSELDMMEAVIEMEETTGDDFGEEDGGGDEDTHITVSEGVDNMLSTSDTTDVDNDVSGVGGVGGVGSVVGRTWGAEKRPAFKQPVSRKKTRFGSMDQQAELTGSAVKSSSNVKQKRRGKKKNFDVETSNVQGRVSSASQTAGGAVRTARRLSPKQSELVGKPSKARGIIDKRAGSVPQITEEPSNAHSGATATSTVAAAAVVVAGSESKDDSGGGSCKTDTTVLAQPKAGAGDEDGTGGGTGMAAKGVTVFRGNRRASIEM